jgi:hypothetical protein
MTRSKFPSSAREICELQLMRTIDPSAAVRNRPLTPDFDRHVQFSVILESGFTVW